jgi:hypothetical protein
MFLMLILPCWSYVAIMWGDHMGRLLILPCVSVEVWMGTQRYQGVRPALECFYFYDLRTIWIVSTSSSSSEHSRARRLDDGMIYVRL